MTKGKEKKGKEAVENNKGQKGTRLLLSTSAFQQEVYPQTNRCIPLKDPPPGMQALPTTQVLDHNSPYSAVLCMFQSISTKASSSR